MPGGELSHDRDPGVGLVTGAGAGDRLSKRLFPLRRSVYALSLDSCLDNTLATGRLVSMLLPLHVSSGLHSYTERNTDYRLLEGRCRLSGGL